MSRPLRLFIKPTPGVSPVFADWNLERGYGLPQGSPGGFRHWVRLLTETAGQLYAPFQGLLSVWPPGAKLDWPGRSPDNPGPYTGSTVTLYVREPLGYACDRSFPPEAEKLPGGLEAFAFANVEVATLNTCLADLLTAQKNMLNKAYGVSTYNETKVLRNLLNGALSLIIPAGHALGCAASDPAQPVVRQCEVAAFTRYGSIDPAYVYETMSAVVEDDIADCLAFLGLIPPNWPLFSASNRQAAIDSTTTTLYPMAVLEQLRRTHNLTPAEWRSVGDNQKNLYLWRLLKRSGRAQAGVPDPVFEFDNDDARNIFQLEAITQFYVNFTDPWEPAASPVLPANPDYQKIDFLDPEGAAAQVNGKVVTLDGSPDLARVTVNTGQKLYDTIFLERDTKAGKRRRYRIMKVDNQQKTVTLDEAPAVQGTTVWRISLRPTLVLIDPFGPRLAGNKATVTQTKDTVIAHQPHTRQVVGGAVQATDLPSQDITLKSAVIKLADPTPDLKKVNPLFDTLYLPTETTGPQHGARPLKTFRIIEVDDAQHTVTVDVADIDAPDSRPVLDGGSSPWSIQAGLGGHLPPFPYRENLGPNPNQHHGADHYDAAMFIVQHNRVQAYYRWASFTSRRAGAVDQSTSSVRGNARYDILSFISGKANINYCFRVTNYKSDGVAEARFYFNTPVEEDRFTASTNAQTQNIPKGSIRLHYSNPFASNYGSGSEGCLVSPRYPEFRSSTVALYAQEHLDYDGTSPAQIIRLQGLSHEQGKALWETRNSAGGVPSADWDEQLRATLWLVRPDERPLGNMGRIA